MVITDRFDHSIDEKNRLSVPSHIRKAMDPITDGAAFYLVPEGRYLQMIPEKLFERLAGWSDARLTVSPEIAKARRLLFATAAKLEWDKQGRCIIPDRFFIDRKTSDPLNEGILSRDVTLVGVGERMELWNRLDFQNHLRELLLDRPAVQVAGAWAMLEMPPTVNHAPQIDA